MSKLRSKVSSLKEEATRGLHVREGILRNRLEKAKFKDQEDRLFNKEATMTLRQHKKGSTSIRIGGGTLREPAAREVEEEENYSSSWDSDFD